jgi:dolichol-phosphate mannosyltransferase
LPGYDKTYVFSDDGSSDSSIQDLQKYFEGYNHVVLGDGKNYGPGHAFNTGFEYILQNSNHEHDRVVTLEADNTSDITILDTMIQISGLQFDLVLASVYSQGGGFEKTSFLRRLLSYGANFVFRFLFNIQVQTLSSFYRVYHVSLLHRVKARYGTCIEQTGFICMLEILSKAIQCQARILEVPMTLRSSARIGKSKMKLIKTSWEYFRYLLKSRSPKNT